jgi:putative ABC transport system permease protein
VQATLKAGVRGSTAHPRTRIALRAAAVAQFAIAVVLLVAAALLGRSLTALMRTDIGVTPENVATASLNLAMDRTLTDRQQVDLVNRVVDRIAAAPGVVAAGVGTARPPDASRMRLTLNRSNDPTAGASYGAAGVPATPGYFAALDIRLERGRLFTNADADGATPVAILSADSARRLFGSQDPVGQRIGLPVLRDGRSRREDMTIVGVTANVKYAGLDRIADDVVYRPFAQQPWRSVFLVARTSGDPEMLASQLRREIAAIDKAITVSEVMTLNEAVADAVAHPRLRSLLLASFATMAILIAGVGLYGVIAYSASQRRGEIGVRMALGADNRRITLMILREGLGLAVIGCALGSAAARGAARLLANLLFGIAPTDPASFALAAAGVVAAGLAASYLPARRAARTDPLAVLRTE